jgi:hypothetical protein
VPGDEPLEPPPHVLREEHRARAEGGDEHEHRAPQELLGNAEVVEEPAQRPDHEQIAAQGHDEQRPVDEIARHRHLGAEEPGPDQRGAHRQIAEHEGGGGGGEVDAEQYLEQEHLAQEEEADEEDPAQAHHEVLHEPAILVARPAEIGVERGEQRHGDDELNGRRELADAVELGRVEGRRDVRQLEGGQRGQPPPATPAMPRLPAARPRRRGVDQLAANGEKRLTTNTLQGIRSMSAVAWWTRSQKSRASTCSVSMTRA